MSSFLSKIGFNSNTRSRITTKTLWFLLEAMTDIELPGFWGNKLQDCHTKTYWNPLFWIHPKFLLLPIIHIYNYFARMIFNVGNVVIHRLNGIIDLKRIINKRLMHVQCPVKKKPYVWPCIVYRWCVLFSIEIYKRNHIFCN